MSVVFMLKLNECEKSAKLQRERREERLSGCCTDSCELVKEVQDYSQGCTHVTRRSNLVALSER